MVHGCHFRGPQPRAACTSLLSPVHRPCGERDRAVRAVRLAVPVPKSKASASNGERLTLGLKAESLNIASHHRTLRYPPQRSFLPHTPRNGMLAVFSPSEH
jgi:hypothetical protein